MENDIVVLVVREEKENERNCDGLACFQEHESEIFAEITSVKRTEFYMANRNGINLDLAVVVNLIDFEQAAIETKNGKLYPSIVKCEDGSYKIIRSYTSDRNKLELMLQKII